MTMFPRRNTANQMLSTSVLPEDYYDPVYLGMHQRSLRATMYGIGDIIRAIIDEGKVKFQYVRSGEIFDTMKDAFEGAGREGVTTFSRLTGTPETSSLNTRGLAGLEQRLLDLQQSILDDPSLAARFGIDNPRDIAFEVGTFKTGMGEKDRLAKIIDKLGEGLIVPEGDEFNFFQIRVGKERLLSLEEMNEILFRTSRVGDQFMGGFFSQDALISKLGNNDLLDLFSKYGKRARGAIGIRDVSLTGDILQQVLENAGIGGVGLSEENVKVFNIAEDMRTMAARYLQAQTLGRVMTDDELSKFILEGMGEEAIDYYGGGNRTLNLIRGALDLSKIGSAEELAEEFLKSKTEGLRSGKYKIFEESVEAAYDGTAVINSKFFKSLKSQMEEEFRQLNAIENKSPEVVARISELSSQIQNMTPENFQAITSRIFMPFRDQAGNVSPRMIKAVVDQANLRSSLQKYAIVAADVVLKKETALMGSTSAMNLVLQGDVSSKVYYDPLAPAFHYDIFSSATYVKAQEARIARLTESFQRAVETGEINESLKRGIYYMADRDISALPEATRSIQERNKIFAQRLKTAIESGVDIRSTPQLLNYLASHVQSQLYREKDGVFQVAMDNVFRVALDTESSFYAGRDASDVGFSVGRGLRDLEIARGVTGGNRSIQAVEFSIQGHKMLFGGNTAMEFKQALGGFDLDDKGIVMPRLLQDASGQARLGTFIFRQPTGPAEFVFAMPKFGTVDTVKMFLESSDALMNQLESLKDQDKYFGYMYETLTAKGSRKQFLEERFRAFAAEDELIEGPGQIEKAMIDLMGRAQTAGNYKIQTLTGEEKIFDILGENLASPLQLTRQRVEDIIASGAIDDKNLEKYLVSQYNYGELVRVFNEKTGFAFDEESRRAFQALGITGDLEGPKAQQVVQQAIEQAKTTGNIDRAISIDNIITKIFNQKTAEALQKKENIGSYINRLVVASASADQEEAIYEALRAKGLGSAVQDIRASTRIAAIGPSDVVDMINYMSGQQGLYMDIERLMSLSGQDPIGAVAAVEKILGKESTELSEAVAQAAIEQKFKRIGMLRARAIEAGLDPSLVAGIDQEFIRARLKSSDDAARALQSLQLGFETEAEKVKTSTTLSAEADKQITDYLSQLKQARKANNYDLTAEVARVAGLAADSIYAHASQNVRLGQMAKDTLDAVNSELYRKSAMNNLSEVNISREASILAQNIMNQYEEMQAKAMSVIDLQNLEIEDVSELMKARKKEQAQIVGNKLRSMILGAAQQSESSTVQDIVDNLERLTYTSRHGKSRRIRNIITGIGGENDIINLFEAAEAQREIKFLERQQNIVSLNEQMQDLMRNVDAMTNEERAYILRQSKDVFEFAGTTATADDRILAAEVIRRFGSESDIRTFKLNEAEELARQRMNQLFQARQRLAQTGMEDVLSFGGRVTDAEGFAPSPIDISLTDEERRIISAGLEDAGDESFVPKSNYKRLVSQWQETKMAEAFKNPTIRKSGYAMLGLIAASFIYAGSKDRGEEEIAGPPLLPGGSAYEQIPMRTPQIPNKSMFNGYRPGVGYSVHIEGSQEQMNNFRESMGSVVNGPINSTMSRGLPQLGRDNFSDIAGSF